MALPAAWQSHAVDVQRAVTGGTDRVQHRVMVGQQLVVRNMPSHFDVEEVGEAAAAADPVEQPGDAPLVLWWSGATPARTRP